MTGIITTRQRRALRAPAAAAVLLLAVTACSSDSNGGSVASAGGEGNPAGIDNAEVAEPLDADAQALDFAECMRAEGIGVANTMVIAVLERRSEIGLRRALGATRGHIRTQFLGESVLLAGLGGIGGAALGGLVTAVFAATHDWPFALPTWVLAGAAVLTVVVGAVAGAYPATRAARLSPTAALTTV